MKMPLSPKEIAQMIDHTLLKPDATEVQIVQLCQEAVAHHFWSVCVNPFWVPRVRRELDGTPVRICTVIGFPLGATSTRAKAAEAEQAIRDGAHELDMVLNVGALKSQNVQAVLDDIRAVVDIAKGKALVKVILETGLLTDAEKIKACQISIEAGADFVKTSTGFGPGGATVADIALMRQTVGPHMGVKASGGVRDFQTALAMIDAGATRIGTSSGIAILSGTPSASETY